MSDYRRAGHLIAALTVLVVGFCACGPKGKQATAENAEPPPGPPSAKDEVIITYYGQGAFLFANDLKVMISPHDDRVGYPMADPTPTADLVLISGDPGDREQTKAVEGEFDVIDKVGEHSVKGAMFRAIEVLRRAKEGAKPRRDIVYAFEWKGVRFCHLGRLGEQLAAEQVKAIGPVNVLMVPVGGGDALDAKEAWAVVGQLKPGMILPMHYKTEKTKPDLGLEGIDRFVKLASKEGSKPKAIVLYGSHFMKVSESNVPAGPMPIVYVLKPW